MTPAPRPYQGCCCPPSLSRDEQGTTAIEYALLAALVAILCVAGLQALGGGTGGLYGQMQAISAAIEASLSR